MCVYVFTQYRQTYLCLCIHIVYLIFILKPHLLKQVHDGHTIPGSGDVNKEQVLEANVTFFTPEPIEKETTKNYQDSEKETKMSREEDGGLEIMKEGKELSTEFIEEGPIQNFEDNKKEAKESKDEVSFYLN